MDRVKTICSDKYGTKMTEMLKPFADKYLNKIRELTREFVDECVEQEIEYNSAYGMFLSISMGELTLAYSKRCLNDLRNEHQ